MLKFGAKKGDFAKFGKNWGGGTAPPAPPPMLCGQIMYFIMIDSCF